MKWRPNEKEWREIRNKYLNENTMLALSIENVATYEAGADAVLEALRLNGKWLEADKTGEYFFLQLPPIKGNGKLVFIPDDEEVSCQTE